MAFCVDLPPWIHFSDAELDVVDAVSLILDVPLWWGRRQATLVHVHDMSVRFVRYDLRHPHRAFRQFNHIFTTHMGELPFWSRTDFTRRGMVALGSKAF